MALERNLYFFDQKSKRKRKPRYRKLPEDLPKSIQLANANINPKLVAFLNKQEKQKKQNDGGSEETEGATLGVPKADGGSIGDFEPASSRGDGESFGEARTGLNFFRMLELDSNAGEEFTQKYLFQEAKYSALKILVRLAKVLYLFKNIHLDMPRETMNGILCGWKELIAQAQYTEVEWQSQINREMAAAKQEATAEEAEKEPPHEPADDADGKKKRKGKKGSDIDSAKMADTAENLKKEQQSGKGAKAAKSKDGKADSEIGRRLSAPKPSTASRVGSDIMSLSSEALSTQLGTNTLVPGYMQVISFSMSSRACEEKGWILHRDEEQHNKERQTVIEWAIRKLQQTLNHIREQQANNKAQGNSQELVLRYYSVSKKEAAQKFGKTKKLPIKPNTYQLMPKVPHMPVIIGTERIFQSTLPDGTSFVYYPSGRTAISLSRSYPLVDGKMAFYANVYEDNEAKSMLASFTPSGMGCCYHNNGKIRFSSYAKGGHLANEDGTITTKWKWPPPHMKISSPVVIQLNNNLSFRCSNQTHMFIQFNCQKESAKFSIGATLENEESPKTSEELGYLMNDYLPFESKAAKESIRPSLMKKKTSKESKHGKRKTKWQAQIEEIHKTLQLPDKYDTDLPAERELGKLQRRARMLCEDWLEHYRISLGIKSPHLQQMDNAPRVKRIRNVHSAKSVLLTVLPPPPQSTDQNEEGKESEVKKVEKKIIIKRAPSAPAYAGDRGRPFSSWSASSRQASATSSPQSRRKEYENKVRIEVEGRQPTSKPSSAVTLSAGSRTSVTPTLSSKTPLPPIKPVSKLKIKTPSTKYSANLHRTPTFHSNTQHERQSIGGGIHPPQVIGCTMTLREEKLGIETNGCHCIRHKIPTITDLEFQDFLQHHVPKTQLSVICITSSLYPEAAPCYQMLLRIHADQNKNRTKPCYQSVGDSFRLFNYDMVMAGQKTQYIEPLLLRRHNAVPGMFFIYMDGKLLFADHIFNGYGNARKDFLKQLQTSRRDYNLGRFLPQDFRFSPAKGRSGPRSAWGGEIGGTGVFQRARSGHTKERTPSASTISSDDRIFLETNMSTDFISASMSGNNGQRIVRHSAFINRQTIPPPNKAVDFRRVQSVK